MEIKRYLAIQLTSLAKTHGRYADTCKIYSGIMSMWVPFSHGAAADNLVYLLVFVGELNFECKPFTFESSHLCPRRKLPLQLRARAAVRVSLQRLQIPPPRKLPQRKLPQARKDRRRKLNQRMEVKPVMAKRRRNLKLKRSAKSCYGILLRRSRLIRWLMRTDRRKPRSKQSPLRQRKKILQMGDFR
jgi:hypothetical protein